MASLLKALAEQGNQTARSVRVVDSPEEKDDTFPMVTSLDQYKAIFMEEINSDRAPVRMLTPAEVKKYEGRGWEIPDGGWAGWDPKVDPGHCARFYIETRSLIVVEHIVNKVAQIQHRNNVHVSLSASQTGTFHHQLMQNRHTATGRWRPAVVEFETEMRPFLDRVVPSKRPLPGEGAKNYELLDGAGAGMTNGWTEMANMNRETLTVHILWVDVTRTKEPRISEDGKVVADTNVTVKGSGTDLSGLTDVMLTLAENQTRLTEALQAQGANPPAQASPSPGPGRPPGRPPSR